MDELNSHPLRTHVGLLGDIFVSKIHGVVWLDSFLTSHMMVFLEICRNLNRFEVFSWYFFIARTFSSFKSSMGERRTEATLGHLLARS